MYDSRTNTSGRTTFYRELRFKLAIRDDVIHKSPTDGVWSDFRRSSGLRQTARVALTIPEQRAFMAELDKPANLRWRPVFTVLLGTGCRVSEVIGLRWQDIDLDRKLINIDHTANYYQAESGSHTFKWEIGDTKTTAGKRTIPMFDEVRDAFIEEREWQKKTGITCNVELDGVSGFLFCNKTGGLLTTSSMNVVLSRIVNEHNSEEEIRASRNKREPMLLPRISCHIMRHTFCTRLCEQETNLKVIQSIMGHKDITTTMNIYADVNEKLKEDSIRNLSERLRLFGESSGNESVI